MALSWFEKFWPWVGAFPLPDRSIGEYHCCFVFSLWKSGRLREIRQRDRIEYWLSIVARNAAINHMKKNQKEMLVFDDSYFDKIPTKEPVRLSEPEKVLNTGILSSKEKLIFKLYFEKGVKLKDISGMLRIPLGTVTSSLTRIRKKFPNKTIKI